VATEPGVDGNAPGLEPKVGSQVQTVQSGLDDVRAADPTPAGLFHIKGIEPHPTATEQVSDDNSDQKK
jgi:hypothetical protein